MSESDESLEESGTERILTFSDGVFAIAITLLVLNINLPQHYDSLPRALRDLFPEYVSYALSFLILGIIWAQHHAVYSLIRRTDPIFLLINIVFLMWVGFLPFPAHVLGENLGKSGEQTAMLFYAGTFLIGTVPYNIFWFYASRSGHLLKADADPVRVALTTRSYKLGPVLYAVDFGLALVNATASLVLFFVIAVFYAVSSIRQISGSRFLAPLFGIKREG
jgi:uncharacterized membrane protein